MPLRGYKLLQVSYIVWRKCHLRKPSLELSKMILLSLQAWLFVFTHLIIICSTFFFVFLQAAFRIRGLSRKQLERLKSKNITLLENGLLDVPQQTWAPVQTLTVFVVKGSNLLSLQEVNIAFNYWVTLYTLRVTSISFLLQHHPSFNLKCHENKGLKWLLTREALDC